MGIPVKCSPPSTHLFHQGNSLQGINFPLQAIAIGLVVGLRNGLVVGLNGLVVGFIIFFDYFITFLDLFITASCFTYGFHTACETLDALSIVIQASPLPLLPFSLPIAVGSVLTIYSAALACRRILPELVGVGFEHCR